jgi:2-methylcitrate dehydratase PrpD
MMVGVQASLLLLLLVGCAAPDWRASGQQARDRQDIVAARREWPLGIRGAMASGVISAGMTADMVRAAWGRPTRVSSSRNELQQHDTWLYTGRQHNADVIGSQTGGAQPLGEWTVAFVGWTD